MDLVHNTLHLVQSGFYPFMSPTALLLKTSLTGLAGAVSYDGALYLYDLITSLKLAYQQSILYTQIQDQLIVVNKLSQQIYEITECTPVYQDGKDMLIELLDKSKQLTDQKSIEQAKLDLLFNQQNELSKQEMTLKYETKPQHYKLMKKALTYGAVGGFIVGGAYLVGKAFLKLGSFILN